MCVCECVCARVCMCVRVHLSACAPSTTTSQNYQPSSRIDNLESQLSKDGSQIDIRANFTRASQHIVLQQDLLLMKFATEDKTTTNQTYHTSTYYIYNQKSIVHILIHIYLINFHDFSETYNNSNINSIMKNTYY